MYIVDIMDLPETSVPHERPAPLETGLGKSTTTAAAATAATAAAAATTAAVAATTAAAATTIATGSRDQGSMHSRNHRTQQQKFAFYHFKIELNTIHSNI